MESVRRTNLTAMFSTVGKFSNCHPTSQIKIRQEGSSLRDIKVESRHRGFDSLKLKCRPKPKPRPRPRPSLSTSWKYRVLLNMSRLLIDTKIKLSRQSETWVLTEIEVKTKTLDILKVVIVSIVTYSSGVFLDMSRLSTNC